jgi:branched-chain amino acid transport system ATP-binding protein
MALLELENVHTYYGHIHALKGISLSVDEAEIVSLIGGNGAGKSTTPNTISGSKPRKDRSLKDENLQDRKPTKLSPRAWCRSRKAGASSPADRE